MSENERELVLNKHNELRKTVTPPASDMLKMVLVIMLKFHYICK